MTIAAGLLCTDGIVICADTEQTLGDSKYDRPKIFPRGDWLLVTGSGSTDYIKMAFDKLSEKFEQGGPENPSQIRRTVEELMLEIFNQHILPFHQAKHPNPPALDLIVGVRCQDGQLALVKGVDSAATLSSHYEVIGMGWHLFEYWAKYFFIAPMSTDVAGYFCMFILREVKAAAYACGGSSHVFKLMKDPKTAKSFTTFWEDTSILTGFPKSVSDILVSCANLSLPVAAVDSQLEGFNQSVKQLRQYFESRKDMKDRAETPYTVTASVILKSQT